MNLPNNISLTGLAPLHSKLQHPGTHFNFINNMSDTSLCYCLHRNSASCKAKNFKAWKTGQKQIQKSSSLLVQCYVGSSVSIVLMAWFNARRLHNFGGYVAKEAIASISSWSRSASMNTSRFSPSMTSAMEWWVIPTRWSVTRPCGKLYVLIRSDLSPLPIYKQVRPWKPVVNLTWEYRNFNLRLPALIEALIDPYGLFAFQFHTVALGEFWEL